MIPEQFSSYLSYSRYRGIYDYSRLSDRYFSKIVDGNLICTDNECTRDFDGNICLVTPAGLVLHIGRFPIPEKGSVSISFDSNDNLHLSYMVYCDCDLKHGVREEEVIDTHLTQERYKKMLAIALGIYLKDKVKGWYGGSFRNKLNFYVKDDNLILSGTKVKVQRYSTKEVGTYNQSISFIDGKGFVLIPDSNGNDLIISEVIMTDSLCYHINEFNKSIGLGKNTTFYLSTFNDNFCSVVDTSDNTCERIDTLTLVNECRLCNVEVVGVDIIGSKYILRKVTGYKKCSS